jgi:large subunit ribosomal protein L30
MAKKLEITQVRSIVGKLKNQKLTIRALGLHRIRETVVHNDTIAIRGMINTVKHLVTVKEV